MHVRNLFYSVKVTIYTTLYTRQRRRKFISIYPLVDTALILSFDGIICMSRHVWIIIKQGFIPMQSGMNAYSIAPCYKTSCTYICGHSAKCNYLPLHAFYPLP